MLIAHYYIIRSCAWSLDEVDHLRRVYDEKDRSVEFQHIKRATFENIVISAGEETRSEWKTRNLRPTHDEYLPTRVIRSVSRSESRSPRDLRAAVAPRITTKFPTILTQNASIFVEVALLKHALKWWKLYEIDAISTWRSSRKKPPIDYLSNYTVERFMVLTDSCLCAGSRSWYYKISNVELSNA